MINQQNSITPPPELVAQWIDAATGSNYEAYIAAVAAQWGADQELEACCEWFKKNTDCHIAIEFLRDARRPKPPSLKEQALEALGRMNQFPTTEDKVTIFRALEQLDD